MFQVKKVKETRLPSVTSAPPLAPLLSAVKAAKGTGGSSENTGLWYIVWKYLVHDNLPDVANRAVVMQEIVSILKKYTLMYLGVKKKPMVYTTYSQMALKKRCLSLSIYIEVYIFISSFVLYKYISLER